MPRRLSAAEALMMARTVGISFAMQEYGTDFNEIH